MRPPHRRLESLTCDIFFPRAVWLPWLSRRASKAVYLRDVHTIAVPTFKNHTLVPRIEVLVTDTVIKQFQQDGTFQIASDDKADATLSGEVSLISRIPARSVRGNVWPLPNSI